MACTEMQREALSEGGVYRNYIRADAFIGEP